MMSRGQLYITVEEYAYTTYDAKYVVKDLQITESAKNVITLSWKAPESTVGGYQVLVDNTWSELLSATTYTTEVLLNGAHEFAVVGIVDGMAKNISEYKSVTLNDEGVKPATDFTVVSMAGKQLSTVRRFTPFPYLGKLLLPSRRLSLTMYITRSTAIKK